MRDHGEHCWAVLPAGGAGTRIGAPIPKQYLEISGKSMLERSVSALLAASWVDRVIVVVAPGDARAGRLLHGQPRVEVVPQGGATRRDSVLAGLRHLCGVEKADPADWVLVHDAARPGLSLASLERLRTALTAKVDGGGLLAVPVADTVKRAAVAADSGTGSATGRPDRQSAQVFATIDRQGLWLAQTPQMFRLGPLAEALERFPDVTDEASAMEAAGHPVRLIEGDRLNFKVTTTDDLELMRRLLGGMG
ncbi:MAG: 2-C-methyl-D-erythritol 4-phosphate cytidylyltransferase [Betaproteobacteria bacterium]|nr:2-C-methyl-D-erythritol 4-phosphate cytidylyltransferase [Betaproteobacteria bacterium]